MTNRHGKNRSIQRRVEHKRPAPNAVAAGLDAVVIHPGPPTIRPGMCPGGVVIHVYAATDPPVLLLTRCYRPGDPIEASAERDATAVADTAEVFLVAYDGDSGDRYSAIDWTEHE